MAEFVEFTNVPVANDVVPLATLALDIPERPTTVGALHEYVVPAGTMLPFCVVCASTGVVLEAVPEQIAASVMSAIVAFGLTVTVTVNVDPVHELDTAGVTV
jgi:hypothetical protein